MDEGLVNSDDTELDEHDLEPEPAWGAAAAGVPEPAEPIDPNAAMCLCGGHCLVTPDEEHMVAATDAPVCCGRLPGGLRCLTLHKDFHEAVGTGEQDSVNRGDSMLGAPTYTIRNEAYMDLWKFMYGGGQPDPDQKQRVQLPLCCKLAVRRVWPSPNGVYMGHQTGREDLVAPGVSSAQYGDHVHNKWDEEELRHSD
jgi:hypothetical protein